MPKKLIEVSLPLEAINTEATREKSIRYGHPSTLHLWWARRPLAAARAVIFSSLVDDPSEHPELFKTPEEQEKERNRLFELIKKLIKWENSNDYNILEEAKNEIAKYNKDYKNGSLTLLDPFAGGGSIPLEAQRLGLNVQASDLNPVAVMINKAMLELPPKFANQSPVNPNAQNESLKEKIQYGATGLAEDVRYYGEWMKQEAFKKIGHLYPKVKVPKEQGGGEATVIAWIWARTVKCPNPACGCEMPLVHSFELSKRKGKEMCIEPVIRHRQISYVVKNDKGSMKGTVTRTGAICLCCGATVSFDYVRSEAKNNRMGTKLTAIISEGQIERIYLSPTSEHEQTAICEEPVNCPQSNLPEKALSFRVQLYGMTKHKNLFTNRQLITLTTFCDLVTKAQKQIENDGGSKEYAKAIAVYLAFVVDKLTHRHSSLCSWDISKNGIAQVFGRHAIPMVWDFAEANPFSNSSGCFDNMLDQVVKCIVKFPALPNSTVKQKTAQVDNGLRNVIVSTDPPYYDNIGYADLSDFFYVWLRQSLKDIEPDLFRMLVVPKQEELVATPYRFAMRKEEGISRSEREKPLTSPSSSLTPKQQAKQFFESGMLETFRQIYKYQRNDIPLTVYYAYKQNETDCNDKTTSSGWETMLSALIQSGFVITGTIPIRTELITGLKSSVNALASSIVLVCRKRAESVGTCKKRQFIVELKRELKPALELLQQGNIAPVDLAQAAIGHGIAVYSRYNAVLNSDNSPVSIREALAEISATIDEVQNEQENELDNETRFLVAWFEQFGYETGDFGVAETLSRAKNTVIDTIAHAELLYSKAGKVRIIKRNEYDYEKFDYQRLTVWEVCQRLVFYLDKYSESGAAELMSKLDGQTVNIARDLAYRLFKLCESKKQTNEAFLFNSLIVSWSEIDRLARQKKNF